MPTLNKLAKILSDVHASDIDECVMKVENGTAIITAMDLTSSLFIQTSAPVELDDMEIGIGGLKLFTKYLNSLNDIDCNVSLVENRLTITPNGGGKVSYLLTEPDQIPTYNEQLAERGDVIGEEVAGYEMHVVLERENVAELLSLMNTFSQNSIEFEVGKRGLVVAHGGSDSSHKIDYQIGKVSKGAASCTVRVYAKHLSAVFGCLEYTAQPTLHLKDQEPVIITSDISNWMLHLVEGQ